MSGERKRTCRVSFRLDADHRDRLDRLRQQWNCVDLTDAIERCIAYAHWDLLGSKEQSSKAAAKILKPKKARK